MLLDYTIINKIVIVLLKYYIVLTIKVISPIVIVIIRYKIILYELLLMNIYCSNFNV